MAKPNITLLGATYSGVAGVTLPTSGGSTATFPWVEGSETKTENGTYDVTNLAELVVNVSGGGGGASIGTKSITNYDATVTSISFENLSGAPKAFFFRCSTVLQRSTSNRHYYVATMVYDGTSVKGNSWYRYNGQFSNVTSGYSYTYSNGTLTLSSTGSQASSPGAFYNSLYELVYIY